MGLHRHAYTINEPTGYLSVIASYAGTGCYQTCPAGHTTCQLVAANITNVDLVLVVLGEERYTSAEEDTPGHTHTLLTTQLVSSTPDCSILERYLFSQDKRLYRQQSVARLRDMVFGVRDA